MRCTLEPTSKVPSSVGEPSFVAETTSDMILDASLAHLASSSVIFLPPAFTLAL